MCAWWREVSIVITTLSFTVLYSFFILDQRVISLRFGLNWETLRSTKYSQARSFWKVYHNEICHAVLKELRMFLKFRVPQSWVLNPWTPGPFGLLEVFYNLAWNAKSDLYRNEQGKVSVVNSYWKLFKIC